MTRVVGIGQPSAGDDGVGPFVIAQLRNDEDLECELCVAREASALIELLKHPDAVYLVDAVLAPEQLGSSWEFSAAERPLEDLARLGNSVSSHGLDVTQAIELCRTLYPSEFTPALCVFAVAIADPARGAPTATSGETALSPVVRNASLRLVEQLRSRLTSSSQRAADHAEARHA